MSSVHEYYRRNYYSSRLRCPFCRRNGHSSENCPTILLSRLYTCIENDRNHESICFVIIRTFTINEIWILLKAIHDERMIEYSIPDYNSFTSFMHIVPIIANILLAEESELDNHSDNDTVIDLTLNDDTLPSPSPNVSSDDTLPANIVLREEYLPATTPPELFSEYSRVYREIRQENDRLQSEVDALEEEEVLREENDRLRFQTEVDVQEEEIHFMNVGDDGEEPRFPPPAPMRVNFEEVPETQEEYEPEAQVENYTEWEEQQYNNNDFWTDPSNNIEMDDDFWPLPPLIDTNGNVLSNQEDAMNNENGFSERLPIQIILNQTIQIIPKSEYCTTEETSCPVCYEDFQKKNTIKTECGHCFCFDCVKKFTKNSNNKCPMCRGKISKLDIYMENLIE